ncbi:flagellum site-determining protein YlxH [bacterium BMS3Abin03]|nr:flagellum site-determining protein YlxH [bacterium BMS3Abin03]
MADITKSGVLNALKKVNDEGLNTNLLTLNSIKEIKVENDSLTVDISLPAVEENTQEKLVDAIKNEFPRLKEIHLNILTKVPPVSTNQGLQKDDILPAVKNTIAVASGKGGVGKSTVAVNVAVALAKEGAKVGLIDADIYGPSIPLMLGINKKPKVFKTESGMKIAPLESHGIKIISIGFLVDDNAPVIWRGPMASGAIKQFMTDVVWEKLDYLIFDMPPGTGDIQLTLVQTIPLTGAVIVTTPQEVSLIDARKALKMFERVNVPVLGIVENMSYFIAPDTGKRYDIFGTGGGENLSAGSDTPFLGGIPIDPRICEGGDKGVPIVYDIPDSENADAIINIARNLIEQVNLRNSKSTGKVEISLGGD